MLTSSTISNILRTSTSYRPVVNVARLRKIACVALGGSMTKGSASVPQEAGNAQRPITVLMAGREAVR